MGDFLEQESERGAVLVVAGMLDEIVKGILQAFFVEGRTAESLLSEKGGALGNYFTRSNLAYVLGLISKTELQRLQIIGELRNQFAHVWEIAKIADIPTVRAKLDELTHLRGGAAPDLRKSTTGPERALFQYEALVLFSELMSRCENTTRRDPHPGSHV